jgi:hypothetical protein
VSVGGQRGIPEGSPRLAVASKDVERCIPDGSPELAVVTMGEEPWNPGRISESHGTFVKLLLLLPLLHLTVARLLRQSIESE